MFPALGQRLSTAVLDGLDIVVELSTLGEFGLAEDGLPLALGSEEGQDPAPEPPRIAPFDRSRDDCPLRGGPGVCAEARS